MKKVLFMFVAVLALASCQKGADKSSEAAASDSAKTEAVEEKSGEAGEAGEVKAPEKTGDLAADLKAHVAFVISKVKACKSMEDLMALEKDPAFKEFEEMAKEAEAKLPADQKKELEEFFKAPENSIEKAMEEKMKEIMPQK